MIESIPADYAIAVLIAWYCSPLGLAASIIAPPLAWAGWMAYIRKTN